MPEFWGEARWARRYFSREFWTDHSQWFQSSSFLSTTMSYFPRHMHSSTVSFRGSLSIVLWLLPFPPRSTRHRTGATAVQGTTRPWYFCATFGNCWVSWRWDSCWWLGRVGSGWFNCGRCWSRSYLLCIWVFIGSMHFSAQLILRWSTIFCCFHFWMISWHGEREIRSRHFLASFYWGFSTNWRVEGWFLGFRPGD